MTQHLFELLRNFFHEYGYWTVAVALLLENSGIPVPGETTLLLAGFLAFSEREMHLGYIILFGIVAATVGDNIGYAAGRYGGRALLERYARIFRIKAEHIARGERLFGRYGPPTVFFARFIFGMRVITGPLAGALCMSWKRFLLFNFLGAVVWVVAVACVGYFFGRQWDEVVEIFKRLDLAVLIGFVVAGVVIWRRKARAKSVLPK
jgi:membrane protein DedA with SNARE-associated domain